MNKHTIKCQAAELRKAILEGYGDVIHKKTIKFSGNLRKDINHMEAHS